MITLYEEEKSLILDTIDDIYDYSIDRCIEASGKGWRWWKNLTLPQVKTIDANIFERLYRLCNLNHLRITDGTEEIKAGAFYSIENLESLRLPITLNKVDREFAKVNSCLEQITIGDGMLALYIPLANANELTEVVSYIYSKDITKLPDIYTTSHSYLQCKLFICENGLNAYFDKIMALVNEVYKDTELAAGLLADNRRYLESMTNNNNYLDLEA